MGLSTKNGPKTIWAGDVTEYFATTDQRFEVPGSIRVAGNGDRFRFVINSTGGAAAAGDWAFKGSAFTHANGIDAEVFSLGQSGKGTSANLFHGIWMSATPSGYGGWIQVFGYNATVNVEGTTDIVIYAQLKGTSGQVYGILDTAVGTAPTVGPFGVVALAGFTTNGTGTIAGYIRGGG